MKSNSKHFSRSALSQLSHPTPYFVFDGERVKENLEEYRTALPGAEICYAMKSNSEPEVLRILADAGSSFEVASTYELAMLKKAGVSPEKILYGTAVKSEDSITDFFEYGVRRFAFDSEEEMRKIARRAPGSKVYARLLVNDEADSVFTMSEKFGARLHAAADLMVKAKAAGLQTYGLSFNVGSQARNAEAWANGLSSLRPSLQALKEQGIELEMVNIGGGFPFSYLPDDGIPAMAEIGAFVGEAMKEMPYPVHLLAEPGRGLVADAYVLVVGVFAKTKRDTGHWVYVDAGAYNALLETMAYQGSMRFRVELLRDSDAEPEQYVLTGPTGDSLDVIDKEALLPSDVKPGDKLVIRDAGAYSFTLATRFNGFPTPPTYGK